MNLKTIVALTFLSTITLVSPAQAENLEHLQQLMSTRQCQRCDLSGSGLVLTNLAGVDLTGADLSTANLNQADLRNANLSGANLEGAVLSRANLTGANLSGANLQGADLREAYLSGVNLDGAILEGASLLGAVGVPATIATPEQIYLWGLTESQRGNYRDAINYYNQALTLKPDFAHAFLARGVSRFRIRDMAGALQDAKRAEELYLAQGNTEGHQTSVQFAQGLEAMQEAIERGDRRAAGRGGGNFMNFLGSLSTFLFQFLF